MSPKMVDYSVATDSGRNPYNLWRRAKDRLLNEVWPEPTPNFQLQPGAKVFTIGSCFARNIERHLQKLGFIVPTLAFSVPPREESIGNGILNKYTPATIFQEIHWAKSIFVKGGEIVEEDSEDFRYECQDGQCIDTNLHGFVPVTRERFFQRRGQVYDTYKEMFSADCVVITLGLIEAWFDREKNVYIQRCPKEKYFLRDRARFAFHRLSYPECHEFVQGSIDAIRAINKDAKFLITTSPVALERTFTDEDVIVAHMHSKSVLRAVAGEIAASNRHVDYFPSYESAVLTKSWAVWNDDLIHVADAFVGKIVARLVDKYCSGVDEACKLFQQSYIDFKSDSVDKALEFARLAAEKSHDNPDIFKHLGDVLARQGDLQQAEEQFRKGLSLRPRNAAPHFQLSDVLARQGRLEEAIVEAQRCIELAPDNEKFRRHLAQLWAQKRKLGRAAIQFALAAGYRRLLRTKRGMLRRFLRLSLPLLHKASRLTYSST
jgi:tetratricopeptide (TPR) repeat protein